MKKYMIEVKLLCDYNKIEIIKTVRYIIGSELQKAKIFVENNLPSVNHSFPSDLEFIREFMLIVTSEQLGDLMAINKINKDAQFEVKDIQVYKMPIFDISVNIS